MMTCKIDAPGADAPDSEFDAEQLAAGIKVEMEHSSDPEVAKKIAKQHLREDPKYYIKLKLVEGEPMQKSLKKAILQKARSRADKFESCVMQVKEKSPDVNAWAVCHAALKKAIIKRSGVKKNEHGWSEDDLRDSVREARTEEVLAKAHMVDFKSRLKAKALPREAGPHEDKSVSLDEPQGKLTVRFTHKPLPKDATGEPHTLHHTLPSNVHGDVLAQNEQYLRQYLKESGLEPMARTKGLTKICLHIPGGSK